MGIKKFLKTDRIKPVKFALATTFGIMILVALLLFLFLTPNEPFKNRILVCVFINSFVLLTGLSIAVLRYFEKELSYMQNLGTKEKWTIYNKIYIRYPIGAGSLYLAFKLYQFTHTDTGWVIVLMIALFAVFSMREIALLGLLLWGIYYFLSFIFAQMPIGIAIIIIALIGIIGIILFVHYLNLRLIHDGIEEFNKKLNELESKLSKIESQVQGLRKNRN